MNKNPLSVILVDDDPEALDVLKTILDELCHVIVLGSFLNVDDAFNSIVEESPDLLFLDIEMPDKNGFDLVQMLEKAKVNSRIVFVTAHDEYAIKAIKHSAFDYILKPIDPQDINDCLYKFSQKHDKEDLDVKVKTLFEQLSRDKIKFNTRSGCIFINPQDIYYAEADGNYTMIHLKHNRKEFVSTHLTDVESQFKGNFQRISRSLLINSDHLIKVDRRKEYIQLGSGKDVIQKEVSYFNLRKHF